MLVMHGRSRLMNSRTRKVGTGSREQDLIGDVITMRRISAGVHDRTDDSVDDVLHTISGAGRLTVARHVIVCLLGEEGSEPVGSVADGGVDIAVSLDDNERQRSDCERPHCSKRRVQYASSSSR